MDAEIATLKAERDKLREAGDVLAAAMEATPILSGDGNPQNRGWEDGDVLTITYGRWNAWFRSRDEALAAWAAK